MLRAIAQFASESDDDGGDNASSSVRTPGLFTEPEVMHVHIPDPVPPPTPKPEKKSGVRWRDQVPESERKQGNASGKRPVRRRRPASEIFADATVLIETGGNYDEVRARRAMRARDKQAAEKRALQENRSPPRERERVPQPKRKAGGRRKGPPSPPPGVRHKLTLPESSSSDGGGNQKALAEVGNRQVGPVLSRKRSKHERRLAPKDRKHKGFKVSYLPHHYMRKMYPDFDDRECLTAPVGPAPIPLRLLEAKKYLNDKARESRQALLIDDISLVRQKKRDADDDEGFRRMDMYNDILMQLDRRTKAPRTNQQRVASRMMKRAMAAKMFGRNYANCVPAIRKRERWQRMNTFVLISQPRRTGKTTVVARNVVAALYVIPKVQIGVFAPSMRQSEMMRAAIEEHMAYFDELRENIVKRNKEELHWLNPNDPKDLREIRCYPCNVDISIPSFPTPTF